MRGRTTWVRTYELVMVLHSVIAGGAETNGQLHRLLPMPCPSPYDTAR